MIDLGLARTLARGSKCKFTGQTHTPAAESQTATPRAGARGNTEKQGFATWKKKSWEDFPRQTGVTRKWKLQTLFKEKSYREEKGKVRGEEKGRVKSCSPAGSQSGPGRTASWGDRNPSNQGED